MFDSLLRLLPPEPAHRLAIWGLSKGLGPRFAAPEDPLLRMELWGRSFAHPIGLAAGFDKNAVAVPGLFKLGFGFVEVGAVTPRPQPGNPSPRLFRLSADRAIVNRMGFNNAGLEAAKAQLSAVALSDFGPLGVNLGANKESEDRAADYESGIRAFAPLADFLTVNVSSPNTERLRDLQGAAALDALLSRCLAARDSAKAAGLGNPALLLKIAPDLSASELADVAEVCLARRIDGIMATNTTLSREGIKDPQREEKGGLSGAPLFERSTQILRDLRRLTRGEIPLIGAGGVSTPEQAYAKIRAGASLVQIYSAMIYEGPGLAAKIARGLPGLLKRDGFASLSAAVGTEKL